ncbi:MAG: hypothetical protein ACI3Z9_03735 [Candidatus Onthomorpha sp.]
MFTEYSLFWLIPIVVFAAGVAFWGYFVGSRAAFSPRQRNLLAALRFLSLLLVLFLLLSPVVRFTSHQSEKPLVVVAQDVSSSIVSVKDSAYYKTDYQTKLRNFIDQASEDYDVKVLTFSSESAERNLQNDNKDFVFSGTQTDIAECLQYVGDEYSDRNLCAVVLASDGIANKGGNPLTLAQDASYPIYTIAMGDTTRRKDLSISNVRCNDLVYADDVFPIEITMKADKAKGESSVVRVLQDGKKIFEKQTTITSERFSITLPLTTSCSQPGVHRFRAEVAPIGDETNTLNNSRDFFVRITDTRQNILILSAAPHPDISAIKQSIQSNKNYKVESCLFGEQNKLKAEQPDLLVAHQIPFDKASFDFVSTLTAKGVPVLYILGGKTDYSLFNRLDAGVKVQLIGRGSQMQAQAVYNPLFALFSLSEEATQMTRDFPPLNVPLARFTLSQDASVLAYQYIGGTKSEYPLLCFCNGTEKKSGVICGENIWKWRLHNYLINQSDKEADEIIEKAVRYLVAAKESNAFKVKHDNVFAKGEQMVFDAYLYNRSYELTNAPEARLVIRSRQGKEFAYTFSKRNNAYTLSVPSLEQGEYTYTAQTSLAGTNYKTIGTFVVSDAHLEMVELVADHSLLATMSKISGGEMFPCDNFDSLLAKMKQNDYIKPVIHSLTTNKRMSESPWYWALIVVVMASEWFLRKYWGRI